MPDLAPLAEAVPYTRNGAAPDYEERIAALERIVASLADAMDSQTSTPASLIDEGRVAALEQSVGTLDRTVRKLPPPNWHRGQYDRMGAIEQRVAALERAVQHLTWSAAPPPPDGNRPAAYDGRRRR